MAWRVLPRPMSSARIARRRPSRKATPSIWCGNRPSASWQAFANTASTPASGVSRSSCAKSEAVPSSGLGSNVAVIAHLPPGLAASPSSPHADAARAGVPQRSGSSGGRGRGRAGRRPSPGDGSGPREPRTRGRVSACGQSASLDAAAGARRGDESSRAVVTGEVRGRAWSQPWCPLLSRRHPESRRSSGRRADTSLLPSLAATSPARSSVALA